MISSTRRSSKSSLEDINQSSRDTSRQLSIPPSDHQDAVNLTRSPTSSKSSQQISPSKFHFSSQSQQHPHDLGFPVSPATGPRHDSLTSETPQRQLLERLVESESEESPAMGQIDWHIQQENMLRQAALDREQIELADRLEEERRFADETMVEEQSCLTESQQTRLLERRPNDLDRSFKAERESSSPSEEPFDVTKQQLDSSAAQRLEEQQRVEEEQPVGGEQERTDQEEEERKLVEQRRIEEDIGQREAERIAEEAQKQIEAERIAEEAQRQLEVERIAEKAQRKSEAEEAPEEDQRQMEAMRMAEEESRRVEAERVVEEAKRLAAEQLEDKERRELEAKRIAEEEGRRLEAVRLVEEENKRVEAERTAKEVRRSEEDQRAEEESKLRAERKAKVERQLEEERMAEEEKQVAEEQTHEGQHKIEEELRVREENKTNEARGSEEELQPEDGCDADMVSRDSSSGELTLQPLEGHTIRDSAVAPEKSIPSDSKSQRAPRGLAPIQTDPSQIDFSLNESSLIPEVNALGLSQPSRNPRPASTIVPVSSIPKEEETRNKHKSAPVRAVKPNEFSDSTFSPSLGRSVSRFSGEEELLKRRLQTEQADTEAQKLIDEMNQLVNEKAMAKEASILSNPSRKSFHDDGSYKPIPVKGSVKTPPPPPPTRSKVIKMAKSFGSANHSRSSSIDSRVSESPPAALPVVPLPPATTPEPEFEFLAHSPVIQGASSVNRPRSLESGCQSPSTNRPSKSAPSSVSSSPSTRTTSLFKPRLSLGSTLLSSIFRTQPDSNPIVANPFAPVLHSYETTESLSAELGHYIIRAQDQALERHKKFVIAISGGSLPILMAPGLLNNPSVKWDTWKVFYADERIVPLDHQDSNFANSMEALFSKVPIDRSQLVSIMGLPADDIDLDEMAPIVASIYTAQVLEELNSSGDGEDLPQFDLILLGMGDDGHTCSLFPSHKLLEDISLISWCNDSPKPSPHRITMTLPILNAARNLAFVCTGSSKNEILAAVLEQEPSSSRPASLVKPGLNPVVWFTDTAAAGKTHYPRTSSQIVPSYDARSIQKDTPPDEVLIEQGTDRGLPAEGMDSYSIATHVGPKDVSIVEDDEILAPDALRRTEHVGFDSVPVAPLDSIQSSRRTEGVSSGKLCDDEGIQVNGLLERVKEDDFGYPYNLIVYPAVYPFINELVYPTAPPDPLLIAPSSSSSLSAVNSALSSPHQVRSPETGSALKNQAYSEGVSRCLAPVDYSEHVATDSMSEDFQPPRSFNARVKMLDLSQRSGYPYNLIVYSPVYPFIQAQLYQKAVPSSPASLGFAENVLPKSTLEDSGSNPASLLPISVSPYESQTTDRSGSEVLSSAISDLTSPISRPNRSGMNSEPRTSPVAILPSGLPPSFYATDSCQTSQPRVISPSMPFTHSIREQAQSQSPIVPAAALDVPPSALGAVFFVDNQTMLSTEGSDAQRNGNPNVEEVYTKTELNNDQQNDMDRQSEGTSSHVSKGESSVNSHATLNQSTDDEWPPTPSSPQGLHSAELMTGVKPEFKDSEPCDTSTQHQSSSTLIPADTRVSMSTIAEASAISPTIAEFHERTNCEDSDSMRSPSQVLSDTTPRANMKDVDMQPHFVSRKFETRPVQDRSSSTLIQADQQVSMSSIAEASLMSPSVALFHEPSCSSSLDGQAQGDQLESPINNKLGLDLGESSQPAYKGDQQRLAKLQIAERFVSETMVQSSAASECLIHPLSAMSHVDANDFSSPTRLVSPPLAERLILSTTTTPQVPKQFPDYEPVAGRDQETSTSPFKIEVDWSVPQVSLPDASVPSPPRSISLPMNPEPIVELSNQRSPVSIDTDRDPFAAPAELCHSNDVQAYLSMEEMSGVGSFAVGKFDETLGEALEFDSTPPKALVFVDQSSSTLVLSNQSDHSTSVHAISADTAVPDPAPQRAPVERAFSVSYFNRVLNQPESPMLPPINLAMDLSDPLSAASTARSEATTVTSQSMPEKPEQSPSDECYFDNSSNDQSDPVRELSAPIPLSESNIEFISAMEAVRHVEASRASELLPAITKRSPTPLSDEQPMTLPGSSLMEDSSSPPPPPPILLPFADLPEISEALAQFIFEAQEVALQRHGKFQLALGGSILPRLLGEGLVGDDRMRWPNWEVFLVEEAIAPLGSPESVLSAVTESILQHVPIPRSQVHSIAELTKTDIAETTAIPEGLDSLADSLADEYENKLLELFPESSHETGQPPEFDLILISVGEEGQVGSLYPAHPMLGESNWFVAWLGDAWEPPSHRIMLTLPVLNSARQFAFVAIGEELAEIVADGLDRSIQSDVPMEEDRVNPTALVKSCNLKPIVWFTDMAAASLTDYPKSSFWDEP